MYKKSVVLVMLCLSLISIPTSLLATEGLVAVESNRTNEHYVKYASKILEAYYRNKDLGEKNNIESFVSTEALELLNAKIKMGQLQNKYLELVYDDYKIEISPFSVKEWREDESKVFMMLQVERSWFYSSDKTTSSEVVEVTLSKHPNGELKMVSCYDLYENITLGPIDKIYKNAILTRENTDEVLANYVHEFKTQSIQKKKQIDLLKEENRFIEKRIVYL